jgi:hypothetical protein
MSSAPRTLIELKLSFQCSSFDVEVVGSLLQFGPNCSSFCDVMLMWLKLLQARLQLPFGNLHEVIWVEDASAGGPRVLSGIYFRVVWHIFQSCLAYLSELFWHIFQSCLAYLSCRGGRYHMWLEG